MSQEGGLDPVEETPDADGFNFNLFLDDATTCAGVYYEQRWIFWDSATKRALAWRPLENNQMTVGCDRRVKE